MAAARAVRPDRLHELLNVRRRLVAVGEAGQRRVDERQRKDALGVIERELKDNAAAHR